MKQKVREENSKVVPFMGYLQPSESSPAPTATVSAINPVHMIIAAVLFAVGLSIGAISVYQSADYQQLQHLETQAKKLTAIKKEICE